MLYTRVSDVNLSQTHGASVVMQCPIQQYTHCQYASKTGEEFTNGGELFRWHACGRVLLRLSTQAPNNLSTVEMLCLANTDPMQQKREREMTNSQVTEGPSQPQQHNNEKNMLHINWRVLRIEPDICGKGKKKWTVGKRESGNNGRLGLWWDLVHVVPRTAWFYYIWRCA